MRIAIIGGSAFSTPSLLAFLDSQSTEPMDIVLTGRSAERLALVRRAASLLVSRKISIRAERMSKDNGLSALQGADCILIQIRVGGYEGRLFDETFPHRYGLCGDEGLGISGLSVGWRTWPVLADILESIADVCPDAFIVLLTSPLSLLVRAAHKYASTNLVGICELPWTTFRDFSRRLSPSLGAIKSDYLGVNHLGWFFNIQSDFGSCLEQLALETENDSFPSSGFLRRNRCVPTRYLRMHYEPERVFEEQVGQNKPRAATLKSVQTNAFGVYGVGSALDVASTLEARPTPWYAEAVGPLLLGLSHQSTKIPLFLSVPNGSYADFLRADDVVECRHQWVDGQAMRVPLLNPPPEHVQENLAKFAHFERIATDAVVNRSVPLLMEALAVHPWTREHAQLESIANEIVTYNESEIPSERR